MLIFKVAAVDLGSHNGIVQFTSRAAIPTGTGPRPPLAPRVNTVIN